MSSTRMATRSLTSPTSTMRSTSLAFFLSLWIRAKSTLRRSAMDVTLHREEGRTRRDAQLLVYDSAWISPCRNGLSAARSDLLNPAIVASYRFAPPASGETMMQFFHSGMFSLIHCRTAGSAYRLSTAMSKKPFMKNKEQRVWFIFHLNKSQVSKYRCAAKLKLKTILLQYEKIVLLIY